MAKKSYKRTMDENKIHEKAVKMRKKTDEQLVHCLLYTSPSPRDS